MMEYYGALARRLVALLVASALLAPTVSFADPSSSDKRPTDQSADSPAPDGAPDSEGRPIMGVAKLVFPAESQYRIGVEDLLLVSVWRDPDLTREVPVRPDGKISLPLIRDVAAAGKTPEELGVEIQNKLKEYINSPSVTVIVREINSIKVYLLGEVVHPGPVVLRSKVRLLQAIAMVGGLTPFGGKKNVVIYRKTRSGEKVIEVSYRSVVSGKRPDDNLVLESDDTVVVR